MGESVPFGLAWRSHSIFILATVATGQFTDILLYSMVIPTLPFLLHDRLGLDGNDLQIHVSSLLATFSAASLVFSIPAGLLADVTATRRTPYLIGLILLILSTVLFAVATDFASLVVARIFQGFSAAIVNAVGLAMVVDTVGLERLGVALGTIRSCIAIGEFAAPAVGGVLYFKFGYKAIFGVSIVALTLDLLMRVLVIEKGVAKKSQLLLIGPKAPVNSAFYPTERDPLLSDRKENPQSKGSVGPYLPILLCLKNSRLVVALGLTFFQAFIFGIYDATLASEAASLFGFTSMEAGLLFLPLGLPNILLSPLFGWCVDRFGTKIVATVGYGSFAPCLALLRMPAQLDTSRTHKIVLLCTVLALQGICSSIVGSPSAVEATQVVDEIAEENPNAFGEKGPYGQLFGLNAFVFNAGLSLGPIFGWFLRAQVGYGNMYALVALMSAGAAITSFIFLGANTGRPVLRS